MLWTGFFSSILHNRNSREEIFLSQWLQVSIKIFCYLQHFSKPLKNKPCIGIIQTNGIKSTDYALETTYKEGFYRSVRTLVRRGPWYEWKRLFRSSFISRPGCFLDSETFFSSLHLEKWRSSCERVPLNAQVKNLLSGFLSLHSSHVKGGFLIPSVLGSRITHPFLLQGITTSTAPTVVPCHRIVTTSHDKMFTICPPPWNFNQALIRI